MRHDDADEPATCSCSVTATRSSLVQDARLGHRRPAQDLARLGVAFDRVFFESAFLVDAAELTASGLRDGRFKRREDGVVVYATGLEGFEGAPLVRPDGVTTQHMRALAYWMACPTLEDMTSMQICGTEWVGHVTCRRKLMDELRAQRQREPAPDPRHLQRDGRATEARWPPARARC